MCRWVRFVVLSVSALLVAAGAVTAAGSAGRGEANPFEVCLVTDAVGLAEHSFNALAAEGVTRAVRELGVSARVLESHSRDDYVANLSSCAQAGSDLTIAAGFLLADATLQAARMFPASTFAIVDWGYGNWPANVAGLVFEPREAGYLAGYLAALMTKSGTISSVGGIEMPSVDEWIDGYQAGARAARPDIVLLNDYSGSFVDQTRCRSIALSQIILKGADVVFNVAGGCGQAALDAAASQQVWGIGVDVDQAYLGSHILTSALKKVDEAVFQTIQMMVDGHTIGGGPISFGLEENGVGLGAISPAVPQQVLDRLDLLRMKPLIGAARIAPGAIAGKRVTVSFAVTRSDNGNPLTTGTMRCDATLAGRPLAHAEQFANGSAQVTFTLPKKAKGKLLTIRLTIEFGGKPFTQLAVFRVR